MVDPILAKLLQKEITRQKEGIELIPSENYVTKEVLKFLGSPLTNKYSEGYAGKRYYGGNEVIDEIEKLAIERAKKLFCVPYANVQPYSGSPANFAVMMALCNPGDTILGQALTMGGHLTHGHSVSASGIFFASSQYGLKSATAKGEDMYDYDVIRQLALEKKPKLIWVGTSAYPLTIHYEKFAEIAAEVGAYLVADIAHIAGLIAGGAHPSPVKYVDVVTTTTHKTLRGPRGAMIMVTEKGLSKDEKLGEKINKAIFPGLQGGPHNHQTAAIAQALFEASTPGFKKYALQVVKNAKSLAEYLTDFGYQLVGGTTENHLILIDLTTTHGIGAGIIVEKALDLVGLTTNKNTIPYDQSSPFYPSGIRLGTPALTSRGMKEKEVKVIAMIINEVLQVCKSYSLPVDKIERADFLKNFTKKLQKENDFSDLHKQVKMLCKDFPLPY